MSHRRLPVPCADRAFFRPWRAARSSSIYLLGVALRSPWPGLPLHHLPRPLDPFVMECPTAPTLVGTLLHMERGWCYEEGGHGHPAAGGHVGAADLSPAQVGAALSGEPPSPTPSRAARLAIEPVLPGFDRKIAISPVGPGGHEVVVATLATTYRSRYAEGEFAGSLPPCAPIRSSARWWPIRLWSLC